MPCRSQDKKRAKYTLKHAIRSMYATPEVWAEHTSAVLHSTLNFLGSSCLRLRADGGDFAFAPHSYTCSTRSAAVSVAVMT